MKQIVLVRHGQTKWNVAEIFRGRTDIGLNETGTKQAELLAEYLNEVKIDAIYSSPLKRALKTAEPVAENHKLDVEIATDLIDFNYGKWQGLSHREVKRKYKELYAQWITNPHLVKMPDGESLDDVKERAMQIVNRVINKYEGTAALISHHVVNKVLICALLGLNNSHFWNIKQDTGGITTFAYENEKFILTNHNDTSYLKSIKKAPLGDF